MRILLHIHTPHQLTTLLLTHSLTPCLEDVLGFTGLMKTTYALTKIAETHERRR